MRSVGLTVMVLGTLALSGCNRSADSAPAAGLMHSETLSPRLSEKLLMEAEAEHCKEGILRNTNFGVGEENAMAYRHYFENDLKQSRFVEKVEVPGNAECSVPDGCIIQMTYHFSEAGQRYEIHFGSGSNGWSQAELCGRVPESVEVIDTEMDEDGKNAAVTYRVKLIVPRVLTEIRSAISGINGTAEHYMKNEPEKIEKTVYFHKFDKGGWRVKMVE